MSPLSISRIISALVAVAILFGGFLMNSARHAQPILNAALGPGEIGSRMREMYNLAGLNFIGKDRAKAEHARLMGAVGKSEMNGFSVIRSRDQRLYRGALLPIYTDNAEKLAECIGYFAARAREEEAGTFFLAAPERVSKYSFEQYGHMPVANVHPAIDSLLYILRSRGVPFLDSRYRFWADGVPDEEVTIATGALMTGAGAFELFAYLLEELEKGTSASLDPDRYFRDPKNYSFQTFAKSFIGSYGKETGPAFSGFDDFVAVSPAFETEFALEGLDMFGQAVAAAGPADETLLDPRRLMRTENFYYFFPQNYYRHSNLTWSVVRNLRNPGGKKILFIHDFYTAQLASFLAYASGELHTLALWDNQTMSAEEYIKGRNFDCVVISLFPANILEERVQRLILKEIPAELEEVEEVFQPDDRFDS